MRARGHPFRSSRRLIFSAYVPVGDVAGSPPLCAYLFALSSAGAIVLIVPRFVHFGV
jgi:hypothetical protein